MRALFGGKGGVSLGLVFLVLFGILVGHFVSYLFRASVFVGSSLLWEV